MIVHMRNVSLQLWNFSAPILLIGLLQRAFLLIRLYRFSKMQEKKSIFRCFNIGIMKYTLLLNPVVARYTHNSFYMI